MASNEEEWTVVTKSKPKPWNERSSGNHLTNEIEPRKLRPNTKPTRYNARDLSRKADKIGGSNPRNFPSSKHQQDYPESGTDRNQLRFNPMKDSFRGNDTYYNKKGIERTSNNIRFQTPEKEKVITKRPGVIILPKGKTTKKKSKKKNKTDPQYLKSVNQVSLDLRDVLKAPITRDKESKKPTGAGIKPQSRTSDKERLAPRNVLDSSAPKKHRGKERVTPKNKRPTKLKRLVLEERRMYRLQRALRETSCEGNGATVDGEELLNNNDVLLPVITLTFVDSDLSETELEPEFNSSSEEGKEPENKVSGDVEEFDGVVVHLEKDELLLFRGEETENLSSVEQTRQIEVVSKPETVITDLETFQVSFIGEGLPGLHTKKFREYCYQMPDKAVDEQATKLLYELMRLQARQHDMNKIKSKGRKRLVFGFHEVTKHLKVQNIKCIVIARDLERSRAIGGLEHQIVSICSLCRSQKVQIIFALTKSTLSFSVCKARTIVSIVGILNYDGRQQIYKDLVQLVTAKELEYSETVRGKREQLLKAGKEFERVTEDEVQSEAGSEISSSSTILQDTDSIASSGSRKKSKKKKKRTNSENSQSIHIKKFEPKDVETSEFIPNNFYPNYYHQYTQYSDSRLEYFDCSYQQVYSPGPYLYYPYSLNPYTQQQYNH